MDNKHALFVYGTLKQGFPNENFLKNSEFVSKVEMDCCILFDLGAVPGLKCLEHTPKNKEHKVIGELWLVNDETLQILDKLEGHPNLYERQRFCWLELTKDKTVEVMTYVYKGMVMDTTPLKEWTKNPLSQRLPQYGRLA